jgi:energy-coupling factor transporter ATP-binding protein EcfA2
LAIAQYQSNYDDGIAGVFRRDEFVAEFAYRYKPGQHVILFGPAGRGKTTLAGLMLAAPGMPKNNGLITTQLGPDPALMHLGKKTDSWPPSPLLLEALLYDHREKGIPLIRRYQPVPKKPEDFITIRRKCARILKWMFGTRGWTLFIPDLQVVTDPGMMGLGKEVDQLIITVRKRFSSIWLDAQAPRWIPRSCSDNTSHLVIWRNRDEASVKRLSQIVGIDFKMLLSMFRSMDYHDSIWVDVPRDEFYIVRAN